MVALALTILLADLRFQGDWVCPDRPAVERQLAELGAVVHGGHVVELEVGRDSDQLLLLDSTGAVLSQRELPPDSHCERRAHVIAVLIASWESAIASRPPELAPSSAGTPTASVVPPAAAVAVVPKTAAPAAMAPPPSPPPPPHATQAEADAQDSATPLEWRLALGPYVAVADGEVALGGVAFVALQPAKSRWSGHLRFFFTTPRTFTLPPGSVSWQRFGGSLGASFAFTRDPLVIEVQADVALALLHTQAQGLEVNRSPDALDPGASVGLMASWRGWTLEPWLGAWVYLWPLVQQAEVTGAASSHTVPQLDLVAGGGVALLLR